MSDPTVTEDSTKRKDMSDEEETERRQRATEILQKHWKNKDNKATREFMNTEQRWNDAALHAKLNVCPTSIILLWTLNPLSYRWKGYLRIKTTTHPGSGGSVQASSRAD